MNNEFEWKSMLDSTEIDNEHLDLIKKKLNIAQKEISKILYEGFLSNRKSLNNKK